MTAHCRTATGRSGDVVITDLTSEGCCIFTKALPVREGLRLHIRPNNFQSLAAVVQWVSGSHAGLKFETPLYGPVAEHLQRSFSNAR